MPIDTRCVFVVSMDVDEANAAHEAPQRPWIRSGRERGKPTEKCRDGESTVTAS